MNQRERGENGQVVLTKGEEKLRTAILESGLPYSEIERRCGVSVSAVSRFVMRDRALSAPNFCLVLEELNLDIVRRADGGYVAIQPNPALLGRPPGRLTRDEEARLPG